MIDFLYPRVISPNTTVYPIIFYEHPILRIRLEDLTLHYIRFKLFYPKKKDLTLDLRMLSQHMREIYNHLGSLFLFATGSLCIGSNSEVHIRQVKVAN